MANTLHRHMTCLGDTVTFDIKASIVERIIGGMFFREDDVLSESSSDSDERQREGLGGKEGREEGLSEARLTSIVCGGGC